MVTKKKLLKEHIPWTEITVPFSFSAKYRKRLHGSFLPFERTPPTQIDILLLTPPFFLFHADYYRSKKDQPTAIRPISFSNIPPTPFHVVVI